MPHHRGDYVKILVAGGMGMIGSNVARIVSSKGHTVAIADLKNGIDLRVFKNCQYALDGVDRVFHLADRTVGLGYSGQHNGQMLTDSLIISMNLLEASRKIGVKEYLYVSSSCVYSDEGSGGAVLESDAMRGSPEKANEGYGWAKRIAERQCVYYSKEYEMRTVIVRPANIYGPSYDWTRPVEDMHVIPALICKMLRGDKEIVVWGSGGQRRTFDFETETAHKIVSLASIGKSGEAYNLGGYEVAIGFLPPMLALIMDYKGKIVFDSSKPEGPFRKAQNIEKMRELIPPWPIKSLEENLRVTVEAARKALA